MSKPSKEQPSTDRRTERTVVNDYEVKGFTVPPLPPQAQFAPLSRPAITGEAVLQQPPPTQSTPSPAAAGGANAPGPSTPTPSSASGPSSPSS